MLLRLPSAAGVTIALLPPGVPSDPQKQARVRVINRAFSEAITKLGGAAKLHTDPVLQNATRFALKLGEHTDGRDVKSNLVDNYSCVGTPRQRPQSLFS